MAEPFYFLTTFASVFTVILGGLLLGFFYSKYFNITIEIYYHMIITGIAFFTLILFAHIIESNNFEDIGDLVSIIILWLIFISSKAIARLISRHISNVNNIKKGDDV
jgi:hypothetical protein